jgi:superfamily I DNA/RNA helicase
MGYASKVRGTERGTVLEDHLPDCTCDTCDPLPAPVHQSANRKWSDQQKAIFGWCKKGEGNLVVVARAGTAKTTTILEGVTYMPEENILMAAFNKRIQEELERRLDSGAAEAKTLHSIGYMLVREYWGGVRTARGDERATQLVKDACKVNGEEEPPYTILKLVAKLHTKGREIMPYASEAIDLMPLAERFECEPEAFWYHQGFGVDYVCNAALACMQLAAKEKPKGGIDFADMIYLPLANKWAMPKYDAGLVDEAQDMTVAQLDLFLKVIKPEGRVCVVGDDRQAIYGFRGADSQSLSRLKDQLDATQLKLTTTFRCGRAIVARAQELVPDIQAWSGVSEGTIRHIDAGDLVDHAKPGDFILSRLNAPLAGYAMQLLREGKRAQIAGRDIGAGLKKLVRKIAKGCTTVDDFLDAVEVWRQKEVKRLLILKFEDRAALVEDQAETLYHLSVHATNIREIEATIERLFSDDGVNNAYVLLSSVHKAKGLEADTVFVLDWTFRPGANQEEDNIIYVATTRARHELVFVEQS